MAHIAAHSVFIQAKAHHFLVCNKHFAAAEKQIWAGNKRLNAGMGKKPHTQKVISSFYACFFLGVFCVCGWQFYVFFVFFRKA